MPWYSVRLISLPSILVLACLAFTYTPTRSGTVFASEAASLATEAIFDCDDGWEGNGPQNLIGSDAPPNIVLIVADDLGYGELGCYGQSKIKTPRLDRLARDGMRFTQFYSGNNVCAPSRCCLMTGRHSGHALIRDNANPQGLDDLKAKYGWEFPGQIPIPLETVTLPGLLKSAGYATAAFGKWGLGHVGTTGDPARHGIDLFYGYYCQVHAHNHYPKFLWRNATKEPLVGNSAKLSGALYSQDRFVEEAIQFLHQKKNDPFFLYLPLIVPHLSIQVPDEELEAYAGTIEEADYEHKAYLKHPKPRAGYAGMITRMDRGIGAILDTLDQLKLNDNTIVIFTSDNGPTYDRLGGTDSVYFNSTAGLRGYKGSMNEGGIRVPCIVRWPKKIQPGSESSLPSAFWDLMPTLLEATGQAIPKDLDGISLLPTLSGTGTQAQHPFLYWESPGYGGQQAVRFGKWKGVRQKMTGLFNRHQPLVTELYDLESDPSESRNLASSHPVELQRALELFAQQHQPSSLFPFPAIDAVP